MNTGDRVIPKDPYLRKIFGEGVVHEVLREEGRDHKETWAHVLFHGESYQEDPNEYDEEDGTLLSVGGDNTVTFDVKDLEAPELCQHSN